MPQLPRHRGRPERRPTRWESLTAEEIAAKVESMPTKDLLQELFLAVAELRRAQARGKSN